jgi:nucleoside-diphosphate-sugar epimerase
LLRAADSAGIESFVYLSSVKALIPPQGVVADESAGRPASDVYGRSKWEGERQLLAQECRCRLNLIRPASVYGRTEGGADSRGKVGRWRGILKALGRLPLLPASGRRSFVGLEDLVRGITLLAEAEHCDRQTYILAEPIFYDLAAIASAVSGAPTRASGILAAGIATLRPLRRLPFIRVLLELERSELYSAARFRRALPWRAQARYSEFLRSGL